MKTRHFATPLFAALLFCLASIINTPVALHAQTPDSKTADSAKSTVPAGTERWGPLLRGLYNQYLSGDIHIAYRIDVSSKKDGVSAGGTGTTSIFKLFPASVTELSVLGIEFSIFSNATGAYMIDADAKTVKPLDSLAAFAAGNPNDLANALNASSGGFTLVGQGREQFSGKSMAYEDYTTSLSDNKLRYYFDGAIWAATRISKDGVDMTLTVLEINTIIPERIREIPKYDIVEDEGVRFKDRLYQYWPEETLPKILPNWHKAEERAHFQSGCGFMSFDVSATSESNKAYMSLLVKNGYTLGKDSTGRQTAENKDVRIIFEIGGNAPYVVYITPKAGGKWHPGILPCIQPPSGKLLAQDADCEDVDTVNFNCNYIIVDMDPKEASNYLKTMLDKWEKTTLETAEENGICQAFSSTVTIDGKKYSIYVQVEEIKGGNCRMSATWENLSAAPEPPKPAKKTKPQAESKPKPERPVFSNKAMYDLLTAFEDYCDRKAELQKANKAKVGVAEKMDALQASAMKMGALKTTATKDLTNKEKKAFEEYVYKYGFWVNAQNDL